MDNKKLRDFTLEGLNLPTMSEAQDESLSKPIMSEENLTEVQITSDLYKALRESLAPQLLRTFRT